MYPCHKGLTYQLFYHPGKIIRLTDALTSYAIAWSLITARNKEHARWVTILMKQKMIKSHRYFFISGILWLSGEKVFLMGFNFDLQIKIIGSDFVAN